MYTTLPLWDSNVFTVCCLRSLSPDVPMHLPPGLPRREQTMLYHLWPGDAFTNCYAFLTEMANSPTCNCDETLTHVISVCRCYSAERQVMCRVLYQLDNRTLSDLNVLGQCSQINSRQTALFAPLRYLRSMGLHDRH